MEEIKLKSYAYIGDALWELFIRERMIKEISDAKELHKVVTSKVNATSQSRYLQMLHNDLTSSELELVRRGRNISVPTARKSNQVEYRQATAFECLLGWLYLNNRPRYEEIIKDLEKII